MVRRGACGLTANRRFPLLKRDHPWPNLACLAVTGQSLTSFAPGFPQLVIPNRTCWNGGGFLPGSSLLTWSLLVPDHWRALFLNFSHFHFTNKLQLCWGQGPSHCSKGGCFLCLLVPPVVAHQVCDKEEVVSFYCGSTWGSEPESCNLSYINTNSGIQSVQALAQSEGGLAARQSKLNLAWTAFMRNWFGGGSQTKAQTCWRETIEFPGTYYFCFPTISNLLSASAETLNGQFAASHTWLHAEARTTSLILCW